MALTSLGHREFNVSVFNGLGADLNNVFTSHVDVIKFHLHDAVNAFL